MASQETSGVRSALWTQNREVPWLEQLGQGHYYHKQDEGIKEMKGPSDFKQQGALS